MKSTGYDAAKQMAKSDKKQTLQRMLIAMQQQMAEMKIQVQRERREKEFMASQMKAEERQTRRLEQRR